MALAPQLEGTGKKRKKDAYIRITGGAGREHECETGKDYHSAVLLPASIVQARDSLRTGFSLHGMHSARVSLRTGCSLHGLLSARVSLRTTRPGTPRGETSMARGRGTVRS